MNIYVQDHGVYGCTFVVATSEENAHEIMRKNSDHYSNYDPSDGLVVIPIEVGSYYENKGDR